MLALSPLRGTNRSLLALCHLMPCPLGHDFCIDPLFKLCPAVSVRCVGYQEGTAKNMITPAANSLRESQSTSWHKRLRNKSRESCSSFSGHVSIGVVICVCVCLSVWLHVIDLIAVSVYAYVFDS